MSTTEDKLEGRPPGGHRRSEVRRPTGRQTPRKRRPRTARPAAAGGLRPDGGDEPLHQAQGHHRPGPHEVVDQAGDAHRHGAQGGVVQCAHLLVPRPDHSGVDPQDPPGGHHQRADQQDAAVAQLRGVDRRAGAVHGGLRLHLAQQPLQGRLRHRVRPAQHPLRALHPDVLPLLRPGPVRAADLARPTRTSARCRCT